MYKSIIFILSATLLLTACNGDFFEQTLDIDPPPYEKQLVVHGFQNSLDSAINISVQRNFGLLDKVKSSDYGISGADVTVTRNGQDNFKLINSGDPEDFYYNQQISPDYFKSGETYGIRVEKDGFPTVTAEQVMPDDFQVDSVAYRENGGVSSGGEKLMAVDVYLKDKPGQKNYYAVEVFTEYTYVITRFDSFGNIIGYDTLSAGGYTLYPEASDDPNAELTDNQVLVSDQFFDGQAYKLSFKAYRSIGQKYEVRVQSITEDCYLYAISAQRKSDTEDFPLVEPVTVHKNVQNGIGIFCLSKTKVFKL
jgi:hypothetical protein